MPGGMGGLPKHMQGTVCLLGAALAWEPKPLTWVLNFLGAAGLLSWRPNMTFFCILDTQTDRACHSFASQFAQSGSESPSHSGRATLRLPERTQKGRRGGTGWLTPTPIIFTQETAPIPILLHDWKLERSSVPTSFLGFCIRDMRASRCLQEHEQAGWEGASNSWEAMLKAGRRTGRKALVWFVLGPLEAHWSEALEA